MSTVPAVTDWTPAELATLRSMWVRHSRAEISARTGRSVKSIDTKVARLRRRGETCFPPREGYQAATRAAERARRPAPAPVAPRHVGEFCQPDRAHAFSRVAEDLNKLKLYTRLRAAGYTGPAALARVYQAVRGEA